MSLTKEDLQQIRSLLKEAINPLEIKLGGVETKVDSLTTFVQKNLVTNDELKELRGEMAKEATINQLYNSVDSYMKQTSDFNQEKKILNHRVDRMEEILKEVAAKLNIKYEV